MGANSKAWSVGFKWTVGDASNPTGAIAVDTTSKALHIADIDDIATDWNVAADSHPTVYIHSATTPATDYIEMYHDATDAHINVASGNLKLELDGTAELTLTTAALAPSTSDGNALGTASLMWADLFLASGAVINFNNGDITITHAANGLAFAGATAANATGYSFDVAAGTIASEAHGIDVTVTGTLASGKSLVGLNVAATAAGTAGAWLSGLFVKAVQASKMVNGYLCAAEFELNSTAANASDNSIIVLNSIRNHTGSPPAADPYILLREYGTTYGNVFLRVFGDTGQGAITGGASTTLLCTGTADKAANCAVRCMFGSTVFWLLGTTTAPS